MPPRLHALVGVGVVVVGVVVVGYGSIGCAPAPGIAVTAAHEIGTFQSAGVRGRDGGASIAVDAGSVWIFGDTFLDNADVDGFTLHSSSFAIVPSSTAPSSTNTTSALDAGGVPTRFTPETDDERAWNEAHQQRADGTCAQTPCGDRFATWPGTSVKRDDGVVLTFYGLIHAAPGAYNFEGVGQSIATWHASDAVPHVERPVFHVDTDHPTLLFKKDEPTFGVAAALDGDELVAFACDTEGVGVPCKLARVKAADALERSKWTFFDGNAYVADIAKAAHVVDAAPIATLTRIGACKRWMLTYSVPLSNDVVARTAEKPEGPWSEAVTLFTANHGDAQNVYDAYVHPELGSDDGKNATVVVSYTRNTPEPFASVTALERVILDVTQLCPAP